MTAKFSRARFENNSILPMIPKEQLRNASCSSSKQIKGLKLKKVKSIKKQKNKIQSSLNIKTFQRFKNKCLTYERFKKESESLNLKENGYSESELIKSLKKETKDRNSSDLMIISKFLLSCDFLEKFKEENIDNISLNKIKFLCSLKLKYKNLKKDEEVFKINENPDNFYLVIKGRISILKPIPKLIEYSGFEYYQYLYNLYLNKEYYLIEITINQNLDLFPLNMKIVSNLNFIIATLLIELKLVKDRLIKSYNNKNNNNKDNIEYLTIKYIINVCFLDNLFDKDELLKLDYLDCRESFEQYGNIILNKIPKFSGTEKQSCKNLTNIYKKYNLTIYEYYNFLELGANTIFGDSAIDKDAKRNATIKMAENTDLAFLDLNFYKTYLKSIKKKAISDDVNFLKFNFIFKNTTSVFDNKYFNYFVYQDLKEGAYISFENTPCEKVYFLKEGEFEFSMNVNIKEFHHLQSLLTSFYNCKKNNFFFDKQEILDNYKNNIIIHSKYLSKNYDEKKKEIIMRTNNLNSVGIESFFFNINYLYTVKVISKTARIYEIHRRFFKDILVHEPSILIDFQEYSKKKINSLIKLLNNLEFVKISIIEKELLYNKLIDKKNENNIIKEIKTSENNFIINNEDDFFSPFEKCIDKKSIKYNKNSVNTQSQSIIKNYELDRIKTIDKFDFKNNNLLKNKIKFLKKNSTFLGEKKLTIDYSNTKSLFNNESTLYTNNFKTINQTPRNSKNKKKNNKLLTNLKKKENILFNYIIDARKQPVRINYLNSKKTKHDKIFLNQIKNEIKEDQLFIAKDPFDKKITFFNNISKEKKIKINKNNFLINFSDYTNNKRQRNKNFNTDGLQNTLTNFNENIKSNEEIKLLTSNLNTFDVNCSKKNSNLTVNTIQAGYTANTSNNLILNNQECDNN